MSKSCCCYFVNQRYLLPALLSAIQARANIKTAGVDVLIFYFGTPDSVFSIFSKICGQYQINLIDITSDRLQGLEVHYAKLLTCDLVDDVYDKILIIDADTQIEGSLDELLRFPLPDGKMLATRDPMTFQLNETAPQWVDKRNYLLSLGLNRHQITRYFNSGVIVCDKKFLLSKRSDLFRKMQEKKGTLRFYDQDIFNPVIGDDHLDMSFKWNYPVFFDTFGLQIPVKAAVRHFMSKPRPWEGAFHPWGKSGFAPYSNLVQRHPELKPFLSPLMGTKRLRYRLQQNFKRYAESGAWNNERFKTAIADYEQQVVV